MKLQWVLGRRHLLSRRSKMLSMVSGITVLGVAFGVMSLLVTLAVINGFQSEYERSVLAFNAHLVVMSGEGEINTDKVNEALEKSGVMSAMKGSTPFLYQEGLAIKGQQVRGLAIKIVDLTSYWMYSDLAHQSLRQDLSGLWVGSALLKDMDGDSDTLKIRLPDIEAGNEVPFRTIPIVGSFASGMYDYDSSFVLMDQQIAKDVLAHKQGSNGMEIWLHDPHQAAELSKDLSEHLAFPYSVLTWRDLNANLFGALQLERLVFSLIMGALILVASFNISGTLTMRILERRGDIAILRAMGARWSQIRSLFFLQGLVLGWTGCLLGLALGLGLLEFIERYKPFKLAAEIYFIEYVPAQWNPMHVVIAIGVTTVFAWLASRVALLRLRKLSIVQALGEI